MVWYLSTGETLPLKFIQLYNRHFIVLNGIQNLEVQKGVQSCVWKNC